jgi:hypothetical protein
MLHEPFSAEHSVEEYGTPSTKPDTVKVSGPPMQFSAQP